MQGKGQVLISYCSISC